MRTTSRMLSLLLLMICFAGALGGCRAAGGGALAPLTYSIWIIWPWDMQPSQDYGYVAKKLQEDTGITLKWSSSPDGTPNQLNVLIASGTIPDLIEAGPLPQFKKLYENDAIWNLEELSRKYDPSFMKSLEKHILVYTRMAFQTKDLFFAPYGWMPRKYWESAAVYRNFSGMVVIDKLYEEIGSPQPKTADDFIAMLKAFKQKHPEMVPAQSSRIGGYSSDGSPFLVSSSLPIAGLAQGFFKKDDGYVGYWEHPDFVKLLQFANTLYVDKLVDPTEFSPNEDREARLHKGLVFCDMNQDADNMDWYSSYLHAVNPDWNWKMIEPVVIDPATMKWEGDYFNGGIGSGTGVVVSKKIKSPDRAIKLLSYFYTEKHQIPNLFGQEGKHWEWMQSDVMKQKIPVYTLDWIERRSKDPSLGDTELGPLTFRLDYWDRLRWLAPPERGGSSPNQAAAFKIAGSHYRDFSFYKTLPPFPPESEEQKIWAEVKDFYSTEVVKIITGSPDKVASAYSAMLSRMKQLGLDKINTFWSRALNEKQAQTDEYSKDLK